MQEILASGSIFHLLNRMLHVKVSRRIKTKLRILAHLAKWMSAEPHLEFTEIRVSGENVLQQGGVCFFITMTATARPGGTAV